MFFLYVNTILFLYCYTVHEKHCKMMDMINKKKCDLGQLLDVLVKVILISLLPSFSGPIFKPIVSSSFEPAYFTI